MYKKIKTTYNVRWREYFIYFFLINFGWNVSYISLVKYKDIHHAVYYILQLYNKN